jgi:hypothetical protein
MNTRQRAVNQLAARFDREPTSTTRCPGVAGRCGMPFSAADVEARFADRIRGLGGVAASVAAWVECDAIKRLMAHERVRVVPPGFWVVGRKRVPPGPDDLVCDLSRPWGGLCAEVYFDDATPPEAP